MYSFIYNYELNILQTMKPYPVSIMSAIYITITETAFICFTIKTWPITCLMVNTQKLKNYEKVINISSSYHL